MTAMIHISRGASTLGVFSEEEVRDGLRSGRFVPGDLGWREGMTNWQPLSQFAEFRETDAAAATPPSSPPPVTSTITLPPTAAGPEASAPRSGLPWDERQSKGVFNAFIETLQLVLGRPATAFTAMKREGGLGEPLLYAIIGGSFGVAFAFVYRFVFRTLVFGVFPNRYATYPYPFEHYFSGLGLILLLLLAPLFVIIGTFIGSAIYHLCLMILGGANQAFETTFRVICFGLGSIYPLLVIPFCGGLVVFVWKIIVYSIGLARAHETDTGRAVGAVLLPLIVCCGGGMLLLALIFGGIGALMHHSGS